MEDRQFPFIYISETSMEIDNALGNKLYYLLDISFAKNIVGTLMLQQGQYRESL